MFELGFVMGLISSAFILTGILSAFVYGFTKSDSRALWTWTVSLLIAFVLLSMG